MNKFRYALKRAGDSDPGNEFVAGCNNYYRRHGFLTEKQVAALDRVTPSRTSCHDYNAVTGGRNLYNDNYADEQNEVYGEAIFDVPNM
ncbi:MAG: hypothetical protein UY48_C0009G0018 [Candidatus Gottesmanbacteria bacterium GW2011_GWB1_49_7]|uniref:Uncharacterized protein n=1 Tax=Candidatus Gottesmanbacteria bacterium GW2011_GWB1_49_7 TaxID=1618448 RepID=A0A0G1W2I5_9BACT|nr:MAG: hypothetical protein UY48_C0009G0018 [Candidatus Gottesmanbacteria bacterium GW2011_GWB1_49_7]